MSETAFDGLIEGPHGVSLAVRADVAVWDSLDVSALCETVVAAIAPLAPRGATFDLWFTDDAALAELNTAYRGKTGPTNVLAFPSGEAGEEAHLGGVAIAYGVAAKEARGRPIPLSHHVTHLALHGLLHLLGFDHENKGDAARMEAVEIDVLAGLGIADPYGGS